MSQKFQKNPLIDLVKDLKKVDDSDSTNKDSAKTEITPINDYLKVKEVKIDMDKKDEDRVKADIVRTFKDHKLEESIKVGVGARNSAKSIAECLIRHN